MSDISKIVKEEGIGEDELSGASETMREMLMNDLTERFGAVPAHITERIGAMRNPDVLKVLHGLAAKCRNIEEFHAYLRQTGIIFRSC